MDIKTNDIDNTKLEEVIQAYLKEPGKEGLMVLTAALLGTKLFVPAMAIPQKGGFQPYVVKNPEGEMYMPAFTSQKKFPKEQKYQGMLKLQYRQCVSMILDNQTLVQGIVLNPSADNLILKTQMLELSRKVEQNAKPNQLRSVTMKAEDFRMVTRHSVEFHQIPEKLYQEKIEFIQTISTEVLCELYKVPYVEMGQEKRFPYTKANFEIMELNVREDLNIMQIVAPAKYLSKTNCREIYIVWNPQTERVGYYVIEKGTEQDQVSYVLDVVKEDGSCEKLEEAPAEGNVINRVMELFEAAQDENAS